MKRHIAIPLLCVVLVAALSIPVFAAPEDSSTFPYPKNDLSGTCIINFSAVNAVLSNPCVGFESLSFGEMWSGKFASVSNTIDDAYLNYGVDVNLSFSLQVLVGGSLYIAFPDGDLTGINFDSLSSYRDPDNDYYVDFGLFWSMNLYTPDPSTKSFVKSSYIDTLKVYFVCFNNVPAGTYQVSTSSMSNQTEKFCFGVYASQCNVYQNIITSVTTGSTSYTEAIDQIMDVYESTKVDEFGALVDVHQRTINAIELTNTLEQLNMSMSSVAAQNASALSSKMGSTVDQFANGEINLSNAMSSLSSDFSSALSGAQTVDEAQAVTAVYKANLKNLEVRNEIQMMQVFDDAMTDEEFQQIQDYYAAESELVNAFDVADFEAQLQFDNWFLLLPQKEAFDYKRFFDYLLNDSEIRYFIIIPLTMGLVSIIMGTRMRVRPSSSGKGDDD